MCVVSLTGTFDSERVKQGHGIYIWMGPTSEEDETPVEKARYEGGYKDGLKHGYGRMKYPNGDLYEGEWVENKMHGEGTYTYKKANDIYSGAWQDGLKHGEGTYEFGADSSLMVGQWEKGELKHGKWVLRGAGVYEGDFLLGRPFGKGTYRFTSGLEQQGEYIKKKPAEGEEEEEAAEEGQPVPPNTTWQGESIVSF